MAAIRHSIVLMHGSLPPSSNSWLPLRIWRFQRPDRRASLRVVGLLLKNPATGQVVLLARHLDGPIAFSELL
ncbi:MAG TPA: hypothetical protein VHX20_05440 [Terracidiphilus sp.]|nr:hypothetical protein [Terracidiphilus sp.]